MYKPKIRNKNHGHGANGLTRNQVSSLTLAQKARNLDGRFV